MQKGLGRKVPPGGRTIEITREFEARSSARVPEEFPIRYTPKDAVVPQTAVHVVQRP